ncbi:MAG: hypothetical protein JXR30_02305 [Alphaproteobacteria bacterium]|nr:hypothetical protein [Alphaproteobacteria bacterium]
MAKEKKVSQQNILWQVNHFKKVVDYLDLSRSILAMVCVEKDGKSLEDYEHYGFLIDVIDHLLKVGEILKSAEDKDLSPIGGRKKLADILETLNRLRKKDIHAGDLDSQLGHWDNLTPEQLAETIEKASEKDEDEKEEQKEKKKNDD